MSLEVHYHQYLGLRFGGIEMRATLNIDDELIEKASELTGIKETTTLVRLALEALIARRSAGRLAELGGTEKQLNAEVDELRPEYERSDFPEGLVRGKYAERLRESTNIVVLKPKVAAVFPNEEAVNNALLSLIEVARKATRPAKGSRRREKSGATGL
jgi:Arc/MetJ family transcription regulator